MGVEFPDELEVCCDECGEDDMVASTQFTGAPGSVGVDDETLKAAGWSRDGYELYCPECTAERRGEDGDDD